MKPATDSLSREFMAGVRMAGAAYDTTARVKRSKKRGQSTFPAANGSGEEETYSDPDFRRKGTLTPLLLLAVGQAQCVVQQASRGDLGTGTRSLDHQRLVAVAVRPDRHAVVGASAAGQRMIGGQ